VTRPAASAAATADRLRALGHEPIVAPLFDYVARAWQPPEGAFDALVLTSAAAVRLAGPGLDALRPLRCHVVGAATAAAAHQAGLAVVSSDAGNAAALLARLAAAGARRVLHLAGRDVVDTPTPPFELVRRVVYAAERRDWSAGEAAAAAAADVALAYSPRAAVALAESLDAAVRARIRLAALSAAVAAAAGDGWAAYDLAATPDDQALFAAAGLLCH
jgi:uroporphyrinogen-III synthase